MQARNKKSEKKIFAPKLAGHTKPTPCYNYCGNTTPGDQRHQLSTAITMKTNCTLRLKNVPNLLTTKIAEPCYMPREPASGTYVLAKGQALQLTLHSTGKRLAFEFILTPH